MRSVSRGGLRPLAIDVVTPLQRWVDRAAAGLILVARERETLLDPRARAGHQVLLAAPFVVQCRARARECRPAVSIISGGGRRGSGRAESDEERQETEEAERTCGGHGRVDDLDTGGSGVRAAVGGGERKLGKPVFGLAGFWRQAGRLLQGWGRRLVAPRCRIKCSVAGGW